MWGDRHTVGVLVVGLVGVFALVLSAATLTDPTGAEAASGWLNLGPGVDAEGVLFTGSIDVPIPVAFLDTLWTALAIASVVFLAVSLVILDAEEITRIVLGVLTMAVLGVVLRVTVGNLGTAGLDLPKGGLFDSSTGLSFTTGKSAPTGGGGLSLSVLAAGAVVVVIAAVVLFARSGDETTLDVSGDDENGGGEQRLVALGEAAGRAAAEIADETTPTSNAVYRAWREMTDALDVPNPETTTAGEFADAAIAAGMAPDDVEALTRLFEDVRYGDAPVSAERAARAREALDRIEATYTGDEQ